MVTLHAIVFVVIVSAIDDIRPFETPRLTSITAYNTYRQTSSISRTKVGNKIVDHSDVAGASPVGTPPTTSSFST